MACCSFSAGLPQGWEDIPSIPEARTGDTEDLTKQILTNINYRNGMPDAYHARIAVRVLVIALTVIGTLVGIMALQGTLTAFPSAFLRLLQNVNWIHVGIGAGIATVLTGGAAFLIHKVKLQKDKLTGQDSGGFTGNEQWTPAVYRSEKRGAHPGYIDTATLDSHGNGQAFMYTLKDEQGHYSVSVMMLIATPLHMIGSIAYNTLRVAVVPFYILGCMLYEKCSGSPIETNRPFSVTDIPQEMGKSLWRIVKAPFYAVAMMYAAIYSLADPLNGRKLGSYLERDWNEGVTRAEGYWSVGGPQSLWRLEGGGTPSGLGRNGFYVAGCWQPIARVRYENGKIADGESLTRAVDPSKGQVYTIFDSAGTAERHSTLLGLLNAQLTE